MDVQQTHRGIVPNLSAGVGLSPAAETCSTAPPWARQSAKDFYHCTALIRPSAASQGPAAVIGKVPHSTSSSPSQEGIPQHQRG